MAKVPSQLSCSIKHAGVCKEKEFSQLCSLIIHRITYTLLPAGQSSAEEQREARLELQVRRVLRRRLYIATTTSYVVRHELLWHICDIAYNVTVIQKEIKST